MADQVKFKKAGPKQQQRACREHSLTDSWRADTADRFVFRGQCYDAGLGSETKCGLCGQHIRLSYVLKMLKSPDQLSPEIGRLTIGECCFQAIKTINPKLYCQLVAAAINLRTYIEAIRRDQRIFGGGDESQVEIPPLPIDVDHKIARMIFDQHGAGGDHV